MLPRLFAQLRRCHDLTEEQQPALATWDCQRFCHVAVIQEAARNHGRVEIAQDRLHNQLVAVKAMPLWWACENHGDFVAAHPKETELPWRDIAVTEYLNNVGFPSACESIGVFRRETRPHGKEICFVMAYCPGGDLLAWLEQSLLDPELDREWKARPLLQQTFSSVAELHRLGIAHGDLSLENILLVDGKTGGSSPATSSIRLIDFSASTGLRCLGPRGKPSYQAPEMHTGEEYDAQAADAFALGVMLFTLVTGNYPWRSTRPHLCPCYRFFQARGLAAYLSQRTLERGGSKAVPLADILSEGAIALLSGLLVVDPASRLTVADALEQPWFSDGPNIGQADHLHGRPETCWRGILVALWGRTKITSKSQICAHTEYGKDCP